MENFRYLIDKLRELPTETEWVEFKTNNEDPDLIGKNISALANAAALYEKTYAYMVWGVDDTTHEIVGTSFKYTLAKKGQEELEGWLRRLLSFNADFTVETVSIEDKDIVLFCITPAISRPIYFEKTAYIRIGSSTKKLHDNPSIETNLWRKLQKTNFENQIAKKDVSYDEISSYIDMTYYFDIKGIPQPTDILKTIHYFVEEKCLQQQDNGLYSITNLGAILFAKKLSNFSSLARKAVRVVSYNDTTRLQLNKQNLFDKGYALCFNEILTYINAIVPSKEIIDSALRETITTYPLLAIRETIANALIHQDLSITGTGPLIEIFANRIEVTNPGLPLVDIYRIIDNPPKSRNEQLASLMRMLKMCEELGTGWDKITDTCEFAQLPAPAINLYQENTKVTLFSYKPFSTLTIEERIWACYLHACIKQVNGDYLTNSSLRLRFGVKETSSGSISRLIKEAVTQKCIRPLDPMTAPRYMKYIPWWA